MKQYASVAVGLPRDPAPKTLALRMAASESLIGEEYSVDVLVGSEPSSVKRTTTEEELAESSTETAFV